MNAICDKCGATLTVGTGYAESEIQAHDCTENKAALADFMKVFTMIREHMQEEGHESVSEYEIGHFASMMTDELAKVRAEAIAGFRQSIIQALPDGFSMEGYGVMIAKRDVIDLSKGEQSNFLA